MTLTPAYGRDYTSKKKALADFNADKDFIINQIGHRYDGKPVNKSQLVGTGRIQIRYKKKTQVAVITV